MPPPTIAPPTQRRSRNGASIATAMPAPVSTIAATSEISVSATL
jgi:hypothetical protein